MIRTLSRLGSLATLALVGATTAHAQMSDVMPAAPTGAITGDVEVKDLISFAATWLLSIAGGVAVLFLVIGGMIYMTAGGSDEKVQKGRKYMMNAVVGLVIVLLAFFIVSQTIKLSFKAGGSGAPAGGGGTVTVTATPANPTVSVGQYYPVVIGCTGATCPPALAASTSAAGTVAVSSTDGGMATSTANIAIPAGSTGIVYLKGVAAGVANVVISGTGITETATVAVTVP